MASDKYKQIRQNSIRQLRNDLNRKKIEYQSFLDGKSFDFPSINNVFLQFNNPKKQLCESKYGKINKPIHGKQVLIVSDQIRRKNSGIKKIIFLNSTIFRNEDKRSFRSSVYCTLNSPNKKHSQKHSKQNQLQKDFILPSFHLSKQKQQNQRLKQMASFFEEDHFSNKNNQRGTDFHLLIERNKQKVYQTEIFNERKTRYKQLNKIAPKKNSFNRPTISFTPWRNPEQLQEGLLL